MQLLAFNASPRKNGNTSTIIGAMLDGARSVGAETTEVRLHDLDMKGCAGCLSCRKDHGHCHQKDALTPYLEAIKTSAGIGVGCPIYMYRVAGQMKLFVDRLYSLFPPKEGGGYGTAVPPGKTYALVVSQGAENPDQYERSVRWLAGMTGRGMGMKEVGRIIHANSHLSPAKDDEKLLAEAFQIGQKLINKD